MTVGRPMNIVNYQLMAALLLKQFMSCRGVNVAPQLLISMVYVGGLLFSEQRNGFSKRKLN